MLLKLVMKSTYKNFGSFKLANCQKSVQFRLVVYTVFLSWFSFRLGSLDVALYVVSAMLPDHKFCKRPKDCLKQQLFLVVYQILDMATLLKLCTTPPLKTQIMFQKRDQFGARLYNKDFEETD